MSRIIVAAILLVAFMAPARADFQDGVAAYERGDYATALRELQPLAEQGDAAAQAALGFMYSKGQGVPQDYAGAVKWYRKAAEQGLADAQYNLGHMYAQGQGVPQDYAGVVKWYRKAAEQGLADAQYMLGVMYGKGQGVPKDYVLTHMWSNLAAARLPPGERHERAVYVRDNVEKLMTPAQLAEAQRLAREWKPKKQ